MLRRITGDNPTTNRTGGAHAIVIVAALFTSVALIFTMFYRTDAAEPANSYFEATWQRTDQPISSGQVDRTWLWGPDGFTGGMIESYAESPGGERTVQYFDKSRMEITDPSAPTNSVWYVTNGLLVVELVTGRMQMGDNSFTQYQPAGVNVAGDRDGLTGPTYATMAGLLDASPLADGLTITQRVDANGIVTSDPALAGFGVTADYLVSVPGIEHQVASPFWAFMNSSGMVYENGAYLTAPMFLSAFYATGYPITEAYWADVKVGGVQQDVLLQCFERRCLTYTPGNPEGWQVEAGNVGQHYYEWRYQQVGEEPYPEGTQTEPPATGTAEPSSTEPPATEPPATGTPPASPTPMTPPTATPEPALDYEYAGKIDDVLDSATTIDRPRGVAAGDGYVYTVEFGDSRVQKFTVDGVYVDSWDGFYNPVDVAIDPEGNVWVTDTNNGIIKKFSPDGTFLTQIGVYGFTCAPGYFVAPTGIAFSNNGEIYIVDRGLHRIQRFDANGAHIATYGDPNCGSGSDNNTFTRPQSIAFDANDNFYITDKGNDRVVKFNAAGAYITEWDSSGDFDDPDGIAVSPSGRVYVVDSGNQRVQGFDFDGVNLGEFGLPGTDPGYFGEPLAIDIDEDGYVYVADFDNGNVQKFDAVGNFLDRFRDNRKGHLSDLNEGMTLDADGNVYVADLALQRILKFDKFGNYLFEFGEFNTGPEEFIEAVRLAASPDGHLYVVDAATGRVLKFTQDGQFVLEWGRIGPGNGEFERAYGVAVDDAGNVYVTDMVKNRVQKFTEEGVFIPEWNDPNVTLNNPMDIAIHGDRAYVVDAGNTRVLSFTVDGSPVGEWGGYGPSCDGSFDSPMGIATDAYGYVYVSDIGFDCVQKFTPDGVFLTAFGEYGSGPGQLYKPYDVEVGANGHVYVLERNNMRVQIFEPVN